MCGQPKICRGLYVICSGQSSLRGSFDPSCSVYRFTCPTPSHGVSLCSPAAASCGPTTKRFWPGPWLRQQTPSKHLQHLCTLLLQRRCRLLPRSQLAMPLYAALCMPFPGAQVITPAPDHGLPAAAARAAAQSGGAAAGAWPARRALLCHSSGCAWLPRAAQHARRCDCEGRSRGSQAGNGAAQARRARARGGACTDLEASGWPVRSRIGRGNPRTQLGPRAARQLPSPAAQPPPPSVRGPHTAPLVPLHNQGPTASGGGGARRRCRPREAGRPPRSRPRRAAPVVHP